MKTEIKKLQGVSFDFINTTDETFRKCKALVALELSRSPGRLQEALMLPEDRSPAGDPREVPDPRASISEQSPTTLEKQLQSGCISVSKTVSLQ